MLKWCALVLADKSYPPHHRKMNMQDKHIAKDRLTRDEYESSPAVAEEIRETSPACVRSCCHTAKTPAAADPARTKDLCTLLGEVEGLDDCNRRH